MVCVKQIIYLPQQSRCYDTKRKIEDRELNRLTISDSVSVVLDSAIASPSLFPDSKALRSESDIFATGDRGSCGVDPSKIENRNLVRVSVVR